LIEWEKHEVALRQLVKPQRFLHCKAVAEEAAVLAQKYGADIAKARLAGLLHDYARDVPEKELLRLAKNNDLVTHRVEEIYPVLLHGPVGALLVKRDLGVNDAAVLKAISHHTTGAPGMALLEKIIYLADFIEPSRNFPGVENIRKLAEVNLDAAILEAMNSSLRYCIIKGSMIHPVTVEARNELIENTRKDN